VIRERFIRTALVATLAISLPAATAAQVEEPTGPEGTDWTLTGYFDGELGELVTVPFEVEPTLLLQDGTASGSGGCNQFSGGYEIDEGSLSFSDELTVTVALCEDPEQSVEDAYLALLGEVDGWVIDEGVLELNDDFGDVILTFEVPGALWTTSQVAALLATISALQDETAALRTEIETLRSDTEALNVTRLRERIKVLESENRKLTNRVQELERAPSVDPTPRPRQTTSFTSAERTLLKGIPTRIANRCRPLRSSLPKGTRAAVSCAPNTSTVASVDYYLMEGARAAAAFANEMDQFNVPDATAADQTCEQGVKSQRQWVGNGWQAEGCYRANKRAELRFIDNATDCKKLRVDGTNVASPTFLIHLQGSNNDVSAVHDWATRNLPAGQRTSITQPIPSTLGLSPSCPT
jgi:heat shock protein HslJ